MQTGFVGDIAASGPSAASGAYSGAPITVGAPSFGAPGGATNVIREIVIGVVIAVLAGLLIKEMGRR